METRAAGNEMLTIKQLTACLKVTEGTIYRITAGKNTPAFKSCGTWRFAHAEIDSGITQQSTEGRGTVGD